MIWLVRIPGGPQDPHEWMLCGNPQNAIHGKGSLAEFADALRASAVRAPVAALLPASRALVSTVSSPIRNARQLQQALPFLVEENLATDIDTIHIVAGTRRGNEVPFVAVSRAEVGLVLSGFGEEGIDPEILTIDGLLLPLPSAAGAAAVFLDGDRSLVSLAGTGQGVLLSLAESDVVASLALTATPPSAIDVHVASEEALVTARAIEAESAGAAVATIHETPVSLLPLLASPGLADRLKSAVNLRAGDFARKGGTMLPALGFDWKPLAALAAVWAVVALGYQLALGISSDRAASAVRDEAVALYRQYFPGSSQVVDPRRQMQALIVQAGSGGADLIGLVAAASEVITELNRAGGQYLTRSLGWEQGTAQLRLDVVARSLEEVEQLRQRLEARGVHVDMGAGLSQDGGYRARLNLGAGT